MLLHRNFYWQAMSAYNASQDEWYQYFSGHGPQWWILAAVYGARSLWATLGLLFNASLVYVTVKSKSLRGICNILLATESGLAVFQDASYYVSFAVVALGPRFIRFGACFWALVPHAVCGDCALMAMVLTGVDRLCAVLFPVWYKKRSVVLYTCFAYLAIFCYAVYVFVIDYLDYSDTKDLMVSCSTHEMGQGRMGPLMRVNGLVLSALLISVYSLTWLFVFQLKATSETVNESSRRLIKSLILIICLNLVGVFFKTGVSLLLQYVQVNVFAKTYFAHLFSFLTIAVYSANAPVLYIMSKEYRKRFDEHLQWLPKMLHIGANSQVSAEPPNNRQT